MNNSVEKPAKSANSDPNLERGSYPLPCGEPVSRDLLTALAILLVTLASLLVLVHLVGITAQRCT